MGVTVATVRVAANTSTGTQDITTSDLGGLTPKAVILLATRGITDGSAASGSGWYIGATDGTRSYVSTFEDEDVGASSDSLNDEHDTAVMEILNGTADGVTDGLASLDSLITNGIRINWTDAPSAGWLITAIFFAGSDLSAYVGIQDLGTGTSAIDVTAPGFEPDAVIALFKNTSGNSMSTGFVHNNRAGTVTQRAAGYRSRTNQANAANAAVVYDDACLAVLGNTSVTAKLSMGSFDSSGFSVTPDASFGSADLLYIALRFGSGPAVSSKVYTFSTPTGTGPNTDTGAGFNPQAVLYVPSLLEAINTYNTTTFSYSQGLSVITTNAQYCNTVSSEDSAADMNTQSLSDNQAVNHPLMTGAAGLAATFSAFTSTGVTLSWSDIETAAKIYIALAIQQSETNLVVADISHSNTLDAVALTQVHNLVVQDVSHTNTLDAVALTQIYNLVVNDISHTHTNKELELTVSTNLVVQDISHTNNLDTVNLVQVHNLIVQDILHSHTLDAVALTQIHNPIVQDIQHNHTSKELELTTSTNLIIQDISHTNTLDNINLIQTHNINTQDILHSHNLDNIVLGGSIEIQDIQHNHNLDNVTLTQVHNLVVQDILHSHTIDNITLSQTHNLSLSDLQHTNTLDDISLTQIHNLSIQDALHSNNLDNIILVIPGGIEVQDIQHTNTLDNVTLTQVHNLLVDDIQHTNTLDNVILTVTYNLTVQDIQHTNSLDNIDIEIAGINLVIQDIIHTNSLDAVVLTQTHTLFVSDIFHTHSLDGVTLSTVSQLFGEEFSCFTYMTPMNTGNSYMTQELIEDVIIYIGITQDEEL